MINMFFMGYLDWRDRDSFIYNSLSLLFLCLMFWFVLHHLVHYFISDSLISKAMKGEKKRKSNVSSLNDKEKLRIAIWKAINYGILSIIGLMVVFNAFIDHSGPEESSGSWIYNYKEYCIPIPTIPMLMVLHYQLTIASYIYGTYTLVFVEHRLKDFWQMLIHHVVTLCLSVGSYYIGHSSRGGCITMILHDICDPIMEIAKCFNYTKHRKMADLFFSLFALTFILSRCVLYPFLIVSPFYTTKNFDFVRGGTVFGYMLTIILILNIFWASLIIRMIFRQLANGTVGGDIRENHE